VSRGASSAGAEEVLEARDVRGVSFTLRRGEILGWFGLVGAGRTETARALFGVDAAGGEVRIGGEPVSIGSPPEAIRRGIALVPEDRKGQGLILKMRIQPNATLAVLPKLSPAGLISAGRERSLVRGYIERLRIRCSGPEQPVGELSGGNQQKVVLAKWLDAAPRALILDEPTKGVDLAAKAEIHTLVRELAASGVGIILISSELEEIRALSDRVLVFKAGRVAGEFDGPSATDAAMMAAAT
jgi:ABC-type sugar transport system ATPase subunit